MCVHLSICGGSGACLACSCSSLPAGLYGTDRAAALRQGCCCMMGMLTQHMQAGAGKAGCALAGVVLAFWGYLVLRAAFTCGLLHVVLDEGCHGGCGWLPCWQGTCLIKGRAIVRGCCTPSHMFEHPWSLLLLPFPWYGCAWHMYVAGCAGARGMHGTHDRPHLG
jgi:hypothetical protein